MESRLEILMLRVKRRFLLNALTRKIFDKVAFGHTEGKRNRAIVEVGQYEQLEKLKPEFLSKKRPGFTYNLKIDRWFLYVEFF